MSAKIFGFGSNMCSARFRDYGVHPEGTGEAALLPGKRLVFNKPSKDGSGKANVVADPNSAVWGVIYSIPDADLDVLDDGEGKGYRRQSMRVYAVAGNAADAWVYVATTPSSDPNLRPYTWYKQFLVDGAKEHGIPPPYVAALETIVADEDRDQARDQERRELM